MTELFIRPDLRPDLSIPSRPEEDGFCFGDVCDPGHDTIHGASFSGCGEKTDKKTAELKEDGGTHKAVKDLHDTGEWSPTGEAAADTYGLIFN